MAKAPGRYHVISKGGTPIGGVKVTTLKFSAEPIDVTDKDSAGIMEVLADSASQSFTMSVEGVYKDPILRTIWASPTTSKLLTDLTFKFADALAAADTLVGNVFMTSYEEGNPDDGPASFSAEFQSSGSWAFT